MKLQNLANLERLKIENELKEKLKIIRELTKILKSPRLMLNIIKDELSELKEKYADPRRTKIMAGKVGEFSPEDLIPKETAIVIITRDGYIKRLSPDNFKTQSRGGKGTIGLTTKEEDSVKQFFTTNTHSDILFFTTRGRVFQLKTYDLPPATRQAKGQAIVNFLQLGPQEKVSAVLPLTELSDCQYLIMQTRQGIIKKVPLADFANVRRNGLIALKLKEGDQLIWVKPSSGKDKIIIATSQGQAIKFSEKDVRPMGRAASGVRGIKLKNADDYVIGLEVIPSLLPEKKYQVLTISRHGYGKRSNLSEYRLQTRGGSGIRTMKITEKTGPLAALRLINAQALGDDLIIISKLGQVIRMPLKSISLLGRSTQGVRVMKFRQKQDEVSSITLV